MSKIDIISTCLGDFGTNCYIVYNKESNKAIIIDPSCDAQLIYDKIVSNKLQVEAILFTHGHLDHIGAADDLVGLFNNKIKKYASEEDIDVAASPIYNLSKMFSTEFEVHVDEGLYDNQIIEFVGTQIKCLLTPGHTKGGMCFYIADEDILFSGDTLFASSVGRSDFPTGNGKTLITSIKTKLAGLPKDTIVYPGHGNTTTIGEELVNNPYIRG